MASDKKFSGLAGIVYDLDELPRILNILTTYDSIVTVAYSPVHSPDHEDKVPHVHVCLEFAQSQTFANCRNYGVGLFANNYVMPLHTQKDIDTYMSYLIHQSKGSLKKEQFPDDEVHFAKGWWDVKRHGENIDRITEFYIALYNKNIVEYKDAMILCMDKFPELIPYFTGRGAYPISCLLNSLRATMQKQEERRRARQ